MSAYRTPTRFIMSAVVGITLIASLLFSSGAQASTTHARTHAKKILICFLVKTLTNPYFVAMRPVAQSEANKLGVTLLYESGKYDGDNATQTSQVDDCITRGAGAIVLIPELSAGIVPAVRRATAKHIAVLALDTATIPASAVTSFVATDNFLAGVKNGQWAKRALAGKKAVFALLEGTLVLGTILRHWEVQLRPETKIELDPKVTLRPKFPVLASVRPRGESEIESRSRSQPSLEPRDYHQSNCKPMITAHCHTR